MTIEEKAHHKFGGSTAKYWANCYGWVKLMETIPYEPAGAAADKGTALHTGILERKTHSEINYIRTGNRLPIVYDDIPNWPIDGAEIAEAFWKSVWVEVLEEFLTGKVTYIEKKLMYSVEEDSGGTADFIVMYHNDKAQLVGCVGDLKSGFVRVEPSEEQLLFYLTCLYLRAKEKGKEIEVFKSFVYQPSHVKPYTEHYFKKSQILKAVDKYQKAINESKKENPKFKVGDYCRWCKVQSKCKAYNKHLGKQMDLAVTDNKITEVEVLPDETLRNIFVYADRIEGYLSAVRKEIISRFAQGKPIEGLKIVAGVSKRKWKAEEFVEETLAAHKINPIVTQKKLLGIGAVEGMLKKAGKSKEDIQAIMYTVTEKPPAPPKITTVDDEREAITLDNGVGLLLAIDENDGEF